SLQRYPQATDFSGNDFSLAEADIEWLKHMVTALRRIRSELGVSPSKQVPLLLHGGDADDRSRSERFDSQLCFLLKLESIRWLDPAMEAPVSATAVVSGGGGSRPALQLFVPLEGLVDLDAERARLDKEIARVSAEKDKSDAKLAKFSDKVPPAVVEQERQRLADWTAQHDALTAQRARLG